MILNIVNEFSNPNPSITAEAWLALKARDASVH